MLIRSLLHGIGLTAMLMFTPVGLCAQKGADQVVEVVFTTDMDKAALERIQEEVRAKGVELDIKNKDFNDGMLTSISFIVTTKKGSGSAACRVDADHRTGFRYDPRGDSQVSLNVGCNLSVPGPSEGK